MDKPPFPLVSALAQARLHQLRLPLSLSSLKKVEGICQCDYRDLIHRQSRKRGKNGWEWAEAVISLFVVLYTNRSRLWRDTSLKVLYRSFPERPATLCWTPG